MQCRWVGWGKADPWRVILRNQGKEKKRESHLNKPQLLPAARAGVEARHERVQEAPEVLLPAGRLAKFAQRDKRRHVVATDFQRRPDVQLDVVRFQIDALVGGRQSHADASPPAGLGDVVAT